MAAESTFVKKAQGFAQEILDQLNSAAAGPNAPTLAVAHNAVLWYQVTIDNHLSLKVDVDKRPVRGQSAFQTDLCIFETFEVAKRTKSGKGKVTIPRVVMEFKTRVTTHDVLTYSAKAKKHKQVYPYLRYGLVASNEASVPGRFFNHNDSLDFCATVGGLDDRQFRALFAPLLRAEVEASRRLENIEFGKIPTRLYRSEVVLEPFGSMSIKAGDIPMGGEGAEEDDDLPTFSLDENIEDADWPKQSWDFPAFMSEGFLGLMGPTFDLDEFKQTISYKAAVQRGQIVNDKWLGPPEGYSNEVLGVEGGPRRHP